LLGRGKHLVWIMEKKEGQIIMDDITDCSSVILQFMLSAIFVEKPIDILYLLLPTTHCAGGAGGGRAKWGQVVGYHAPNA
jgi:hypothetical protein